MTAPVRGEGRAIFAAILLLIVGIFNATYGIAFIAEDEVVIQGLPDNGVAVVGDLTMWGWIMLILGVVEILAGLALFAGQTWARVVAIIGAGLAALSQLPVIVGPHPAWSLLIIAGCIWVIHGLVVYGEPAT